MGLEIIDISKDYFSVRPGMAIYNSMPKRDMLNALNENKAALFAEITSLVNFLTPYCNFMPCDHCCVPFSDYINEKGVFPVMPETAAIELTDLLQSAKQFTNSGGEVFLLDKKIRENAAEQGKISQWLINSLDGFDYLMKLVNHHAEKLRTDWDTINNISPINLIDKNRSVRIPTNGFLFPELEEKDKKDAEHLRNSDLYRLLKGYRGISLQLSIGPFQEIKYIQEGFSLKKKIDDLYIVSKQLSRDFCDEYPDKKLPNFSLGFMFTYLHGDPDLFDKELSERYNGLRLPTQDFDNNETLLFAAQKSIVEMQPVMAVANGRKLNGANKNFSARPKKHISEIDELYAAVLKDNMIGIFTNTIHMYAGKPENAVILFKTYS